MAGAVVSMLLAVWGQAEARTLEESDADLAQKAEAEFRAGADSRADRNKAREHFGRSAHYFEMLRQRGCSNVDLILNLGHAQLLAGDVPGSIQTFHRGLRLAPENAVLTKAMSHARTQVLFSEDNPLGRPVESSRPWWLPRSGRILLAAAIAYALAWLALARWLMVRLFAWMATSAVLLLLAISVALCGALMYHAETEETAVVRVIVRHPVWLRKGPGWLPGTKDPTYPTQHSAPLVVGAEGRFLAQRDDWLRIELAGGVSGWVPALAVLLDDP